MKEFSPFEVVLSQCPQGCCYKGTMKFNTGQDIPFLSLCRHTMKMPGVEAAVKVLMKAISDGLAAETMRLLKENGIEVTAKCVVVKPHEMN